MFIKRLGGSARGVTLTVLLLLVACGPSTQPGATGPGVGTGSPAGPGQSAPTGLRQDSAQASGAAEWDQVLLAAKREGKIVIMGPPGDNASEAFAAAFQARYPEIQVEYTGQTGSALASKLIGERTAGLYQVDLFIGGSQTVIVSLLPVNALDPALPYLTGPAIEPDKWLGGRLEFLDDAAQYSLTFSSYTNTPFSYNKVSVSPGEIRSWQDLLSAKWKGKIAMIDPRGSGPTLDIVSFWYFTPTLGKEFLQHMFSTQEIVLSREERQIADWVAKGQYSIGIGAGLLTTELQAKGVPIEVIDADEALREGTFITSGFGNVSVLNRAPHPNAVRVYLNWLLSRDGQAVWSNQSLTASRRLDVPTDHLDRRVVPKPGKTYVETYRESYVKKKDAEVRPLLTSIIGS
jgi:iron(III) transport system substrate-binding protein